MKNIIKNIILLLIICIPVHTLAFDDDITHPHITDAALGVSKIYVYLHDNFAFATIADGNGDIIDTTFDGEYVSKLIKKGSTLEDTPACRASNHFHNPLKDWSESGLTDTWWLVNAYCTLGDYPAGKISSNITWGTGYKTLNSRDSNVLDANEWDWESARGYFYTYLTGKDYKNGTLIAPEQASRNLHMKNCFRAVGQVMHLLQDSAVPAHVRNDFSQGHTQIRWSSYEWPSIGNPFEVYVKEKDQNLIIEWFKTAKRSNFSDSFLTQFWDTDQLNNNYIGGDMSALGLAEYTNLNFLSAFTLFTDDLPSADPHYFPFPSAQDCTIKYKPGPEGILDINRKYIATSAGHPGELVDRLAIVGHAMHFRKKYFPNISNQKLPVYINDDCYEEYAEKLIPRAIGYSADLLDYFFRGDIHILRPAFVRGPDSDITGLTFSVKNATPPLIDGEAVEAFESGTIELVYKYSEPDAQNPGAYLPVIKAVDVYSIGDAGAGDPINSGYVNRNVVFPQGEEIPAEAIDISFSLVFKGKLGKENGAVVGKVFDLNTSRIAYFYQPNGEPNPSSIFTVSPDGSDSYEIMSTDPDIHYFHPAWSKDGTMMAFIKRFCPDGSPNCDQTPGIFDSELIIIDLLSDQPYPGNILYTLHMGTAATALFCPVFSPDGAKIAVTAIPQDDYSIVRLVALNLEPTVSWQIIDESHSGEPTYTMISTHGIDWSPDGNQIMYAVNKDLYTIHPDGTGKNIFLADGNINGTPRYSPDNKWIAYRTKITLPDEKVHIWRIDTDGQNKQEITNCLPGDCYYHSISPKGDRIAYSNHISIYSIQSDGAPSTKKVVAGFSQPGNSGNAAWSPIISPPFIETAQATPNAIDIGEAVTIAWQTYDATEITITGMAGKLPANGSTIVYPSDTITYTITAIGPRGKAQKDVKVTVNPLP